MCEKSCDQQYETLCEPCKKKYVIKFDCGKMDMVDCVHGIKLDVRKIKVDGCELGSNITKSIKKLISLCQNNNKSINAKFSYLVNCVCQKTCFTITNMKLINKNTLFIKTKAELCSKNFSKGNLNFCM